MRILYISSIIITQIILGMCFVDRENVRLLNDQVGSRWHLLSEMDVAIPAMMESTNMSIPKVNVRWLSYDELFDAATFCIIHFFEKKGAYREYEDSNKVLDAFSYFMDERNKLEMLRQLNTVQLNELRARFDDRRRADAMFVAESPEISTSQENGGYVGFAEVFMWQLGTALTETLCANAVSAPNDDREKRWEAFIQAGRGDGTAVCVPKIANVCVAPNLRRCGVGASLVRHCCAQAADWGAPFVVLQVDHDNKGARRFYRKLGFEEIAIQQNMWRYDLSGKKLKSVLAPKILMRLDLRSDFCMKGRVKQ